MDSVSQFPPAPPATNPPNAGVRSPMSEQINRTRQHVLQIFAEMNSKDTSLCETVLVRDGVYCGHRFSCDEFTAVWFFEENEIKVYNHDRKLLRVESMGHDGEYRRAA